MRNKIRISYYNLFSHFYDSFVALHSGDPGGRLRDHLARKVGLKRGDVVLDICTGTGAMLPSLRKCVDEEGMVIGLDFSIGMLKTARSKLASYPDIFLIQADVSSLPFKSGVFSGITCSHAFYELKGDTTVKCLGEINRVLKEGKNFLMMEHEVPENRFVRMLFYIRIFFMGRKKALEILRNEKRMFKSNFSRVDKTKTEDGKSKIILCQKGFGALISAG
jgi:demethylmenaquinone methyltransferase/2-methoxy-6-polyprenyl-1,4-benzoquinol methylase